MCLQSMKALRLARLHKCAGLSQPSLIADVIRNLPIFSSTGLGQHRSFANSSREEILDFLDVVSSQGALPPADSFPSLEELNEDDEQVILP